MNNNKSFYFMLVLAVIFTVYWLFFAPKNDQQNSTINTEVTTDSSFTTPNNSSQQNIVTNVQNQFSSLTESNDYSQQLLTYQNDNLRVLFSDKGAFIKDVYINDRFLGRDGNTEHHILEGTEEDGGLILKMGAWNTGYTLKQILNNNDYFKLERAGNQFIFINNFINNNTQSVYTIKKIYTFYENDFVFKLDLEITNSLNEEMKFDNSNSSFSIGWGPTLGIVGEKHDKRQKNLLSYYNGKKIIDIAHKNRRLFPNNSRFNDSVSVDAGGWVVSNGHYFASAIIPDSQRYRYFFDYREMENNRYFTGLTRDVSRSSVNSSFRIYIGPKVSSVLRPYNNNRQMGDINLIGSGINKLERMILFGIGNVIGKGLSFIYSIVKNYGIAIIILTILIKLLLSPLTHSSMVSQKKMMAIQPKIKEIQLKFKDNPQKIQEETMKCYSQNKINPLGGCLPLFLQMPLLIAMYELLVNMVELKGSSFLWIHDLSTPDKILDIPISIFGLSGIPIHILPIFMVLTQFLTSFLTPASGANNNQTKIMMAMLPLVFFFMFYNVSSALVLYWTVMNILNLIQQVFVNRTELLKKLQFIRGVK